MCAPLASNESLNVERWPAYPLRTRRRGSWEDVSRIPGRPPMSEATQALIVRMATENGWRAREIQAALSKLGIHLGLTTISRLYVPNIRPH
jgi:hypothetical protein